jgi:hypothetical protein
MRRLALLLPLFACAPASHPWSSRSLCEGTIDRNASLDAGTWFALLLRGYDQKTRQVTTPAVDCTGAQVRWDAPAALCIDGSVTRTLLPARPLDERDVVIAPYAENVQLVWVMTGRYAAGDALGPVAIVERKRDDLLVRAAGVLRAFPGRAKLRLEKVGATEILVAEGERCAGRDPSTCQRGARVVPLRGDRFRPEQFLSEEGACLSPAWVDLSREESERLDAGIRRFQLTASLSFEPALLRIDEEIVVHDFDPSKPATPPRLVRRAHGDRVITVSDSKMVVSAQSLWMKAVNAE